MQISEVSFEEIEQIWSKYLWPDRISKIEPISLIDRDGNIDKQILEIAKPKFLKLHSGNEVFGVTSFLMTEPHVWRLRGTWVDESLRRRNLGSQLLQESMSLIKEVDLKPSVWTMARKNSDSFYLKNGFVKKKLITNYEFGPHFIMTRSLST